jgi:hypothetical protein
VLVIVVGVPWICTTSHKASAGSIDSDSAAASLIAHVLRPVAALAV